ncbi:trichohyalin [Drosophila kikkawai]|uniref:Trichohyalin n=1 Tax=Drosophila kikkawai TaxID=30033 RepID=A0ABM4GKL9_DROKI
MANNKTVITGEELLQRSCRKKMDLIRHLIRQKNSAEDRALCKSWLSYLNSCAEHQARARDCVLDQMVRQLRLVGRLSKPFTTHVKCRTDLRLLLDEEGRQRLLRFSPPEVEAPKPSTESLFRRSRSRRPSPFAWPQRVEHLNTLEKQYRREERGLWFNETSVSSQPKEGTGIKEVRVQVGQRDRDLLDRARKRQEIKKKRDRERQRVLNDGLHWAAEQRQLDLQRKAEARQLRESRLLEQQLKVKERRDHERYLMNKRREAQSPRPLPRKDHLSKVPAHHQRQDKAKEVEKKVKLEEPVQEARKNVKCQTFHRSCSLPLATNCGHCDVREQQSVLRAENVKQKVMAYEGLKQFHREKALAERARLKEERLDREQADNRRQIAKGERRSQKDKSKFHKEQEANQEEPTDALNVIGSKTKRGEDSKRKVKFERNQEFKENESQEKSENRETENGDDSFNSREKRMLAKWINLQKKYDVPVGELSPAQERERRKEEIRAKKEFLREASEQTEPISEEALPKRKEEKLSGQSIEEERLNNDHNKVKKQTKKRNMEEQPPEDRMSQQSDSDMVVQQAHEKFLNLAAELCQKSEPKADPYGDLQSCLKKIQIERDLLTKQIRDRCEEFKKQKTLARAEGGSTRKRDLISYSLKMAQDNRMQAKIIKKKCLQELQNVEHALQKIQYAGDDLTLEVEADDRLPKDIEELSEKCIRVELFKNQTEKRYMEEQPLEDCKSEQSDSDIAVRQAHENFLNQVEQICQERKPLQSSLKKNQKEKDLLTKQICESCEEIQKQKHLPRVKGGSTKKRDLISSSRKISQENWKQENILRYKCLLELLDVEAILNRIQSVGEDATTEGDGRSHSKESHVGSIQTPKDQPLQAGDRERTEMESKGEDLPQLNSFRVYKEVDDLVPKPPIPRMALPEKKIYSGSIVSYCTKTGRKRYPHISQGRHIQMKKQMLHRQTFSQLLSGSRPTELNQETLAAQNSILQRKLSDAKKITVNNLIHKNLTQKAGQLVDYFLYEKAKAQEDIKPPRHVFQSLIDPLLQGMENVSPKVLKTISHLDGQMETQLSNLNNCTFGRQEIRQQVTYEQSGEQLSGLDREHLVLELLNHFCDLDPQLNKILQRIDKLYRTWKDLRLGLQ